MKKFLIFSIVYIPFVGGAELAVKEITDHIHDFQFDMITLRFDKKPASPKTASRGGWPKFEKIGNVNVYRINGSKLFFPFNAFLKARFLYKKNNYNIAWSIMANRAGFAALFFKIFHPKVKFLLTLQEGDALDYPEKRAGILWPLVKFLFKCIFIKADYVQAISRYLAQWAKNMGTKSPIEVVPNGVDIDKFEIRNSKFEKNFKSEIQNLKQKLDVKTDEKLIITTSRLVLKNAVDDVVKSLKFLPENVKFLVLGTGPDLEKLQNLAKEIGVEKRVMFLGQISHEEMPKYLQISDIFVRPSLSEGLGNSFLEAMAASVPVIATPVGGIPDFLKDGETGLFCEVNNPQSIAEKVMEYINNPDRTDKIVENAQKLVREKYDWNLISKKMKNIFEKLLS